MKNKKNFFKRKTTTAVFALVGLIGGFSFLNQSITGNIILNGNYPLSLVSVVGLLLILCSVILAIYTIKKK